MRKGYFLVIKYAHFVRLLNLIVKRGTSFNSTSTVQPLKKLVSSWYCFKSALGAKVTAVGSH